MIPNGIDLTVFRPTDSSFRQEYGIESRKLILGVSFDWGYSKGLLAGRLPEDFQIVLVGTDAASERSLPKGVLTLRRTQNQQELAEIYTAADVFVNPTREDNFPTVDLEALACGTPIVTFRTGGSPETIDETCGSAVECDDVDALEQEILRVCTEKPFSEAQCVARARKFERNQRFKEYLELYERIVASGTEGN